MNILWWNFVIAWSRDYIINGSANIRRVLWGVNVFIANYILGWCRNLAVVGLASGKNSDTHIHHAGSTEHTQPISMVAATGLSKVHGA